ncbi:MAG TPA: hypothetical protein VLH10_12230 [Yinghuangia sp.]|nr:hypothetical protein [Yinghuangia sp.]
MLIHAGLGVDQDALRELPADLADLPRKAVVALARITDAHTDCDGGCSPWAQAAAPWHWRLADVVALTEPVPTPGAQGLWIPDPGLRRRVARALPAHAAGLLQ